LSAKLQTAVNRFFETTLRFGVAKNTEYINSKVFFFTYVYYPQPTQILEPPVRESQFVSSLQFGCFQQKHDLKFLIVKMLPSLQT
jgi:hypothetical protein